MRKEQYINERVSKSNGLKSYQVYIRHEGYPTIIKTFSEKDYGSAKEAHDNAVIFKNKKLYEIYEGTMLRESRMTVSDCFEDYFENSNDSYNTRCKHRKVYRKYIKCKDMPIQKVTKSIILDDLNSVVDVASDDTIRRIYSIWKKDIIGTALYKEIINKDVTLGIKIPKSKIIVKKKETTTNREIVIQVENLILNSLKSSYNARIICFLIELLFYTGLRPAEAEALTRDDIHTNYISVNKQLGSNKDDINVITRCKTRTSVRKVPIHPQLVPILNELFAFAKYDELFKDEDGHYMDSTKIGCTIRHLTKDKGIDFNLYRLRHNVATELITNNVDNKTTMEILGHSNYNMSVYYANSNDDLKENAIQLIS